MNLELSRRFLNITEVAVYLSCSVQTAEKFCESISAKRKMGKRNLYDVDVINAYFDNQSNTSKRDS